MSGHKAAAELAQAMELGINSFREITAVSATVPVSLSGDSLFYSVTSASANYAIELPKAVPGRVVRGWVGANGCEIWAQGTNVKINDVICSATNEAAIPATSIFRLECVSPTEWILTANTELGAAITAIVPDAR